MKTLLIIGNDKASSWLGNRINQLDLKDVTLVVDKSTNFKRIKNILFKRRMSISTLIKIMWAEICRKRLSFQAITQIQSNQDLLNCIEKFNPDRVLCFRCGLIINRTVLATGVPVYNIHVSDLPQFPGLGTIAKAINAKAWHQNACLHYIDEGIDTGDIIQKEPYELSPVNSYKTNEDTAYLAGLNLAIQYLMQSK